MPRVQVRQSDPMSHFMGQGMQEIDLDLAMPYDRLCTIANEGVIARVVLGQFGIGAARNDVGAVATGRRAITKSHAHLRDPVPIQLAGLAYRLDYLFHQQCALLCGPSARAFTCLLLNGHISAQPLGATCGVWIGR